MLRLPKGRHYLPVAGKSPFGERCRGAGMKQSPPQEWVVLNSIGELRRGMLRMGFQRVSEAVVINRQAMFEVGGVKDYLG